MKSARRRGALAITYHVTLTPRSAGGAAAAWQQETAQGTRVASQGCGTCCGAGRRGLGVSGRPPHRLHASHASVHTNSDTAAEVLDVDVVLEVKAHAPIALLPAHASGV